MEDIKYMLWLSAVFGNNDKFVKNILEIFQTAEGAYHDITFGSTLVRLTNMQQRALKSNPMSVIEEKIGRYRESGINVTGINQPDYPKGLKYIFQPPLILYYKGDISCIDKKNVISCVGTRKPSGYTVSVAKEICRSLAEKDYTIASGFAVGTDIVCHLSAVESDRPTACVLGSGINVDYPTENTEYKEKILESGGVFISEFEPSARAYPQNFHRRNRILSAISKAVVVFEAPEKSGSLITANIALEQGKEIFALPPADIFDSRYQGNINLLRDGAKPVYSVEDITEFFDSYRPTNRLVRQSVKKAVKPLQIQTAEEEKNTAPQIKADGNADNGGDTDGFVMNESQKKIIEVLKTCTLHKDVIIKRTNADINEIALDLMELEIMGYIRSLPGNLFELK